MRRTMYFLFTAMTAGCAGSAEAPRVELPVVVDSHGIAPVTTNLGYTVTVTVFRAALSDLELAVGGETHDRLALEPGDGPVLYHPGHLAGGEVTGEMPGDFVIDWMSDGASLGTADLIVGDYESANVAFRRAGRADALAADDPLMGHSFYIEGTFDGGSGAQPFRASVDVDQETPLVGALFDADIAETEPVSLGLQVRLIDPIEGDTLFDHIDFSSLTGEDAQARIVPGEEAHTILERTIKIHDHYAVVTR